MNFFIFPVVVAILCMGCENTVNHLPGGISKTDKAFFDSIRQNSDTGFTRIIGAGEFYSAEQYYSRGDSIVSKIMKDTAGNITGFVQFRKNIRTAYAEYYANGQLKGKLLLDSLGRFEGPATYYYEDGSIRSEGVYNLGFFWGKWNNYAPGGALVSTDEYDTNGQLIHTVTTKR
ncbi:hypothetical protein [Agriterribacter sp.]|uniref:toxin-antitoxin system YwqK family antitoxin n=1 Tax=Agriterribacter sp. TaxID=2821509 RepID=UPI002BD28D95|nr:hypothetical protein [Agriterribacter sp.]HRO47452.1 hypothetical protein [Agriterribacter sp.]HRQ15891.1 hypothetical protein [Agriterribacter sp.]